MVITEQMLFSSLIPIATCNGLKDKKFGIRLCVRLFLNDLPQFKHF
jgi:hypothetical protein